MRSGADKLESAVYPPQHDSGDAREETGIAEALGKRRIRIISEAVELHTDYRLGDPALVLHAGPLGIQPGAIQVKLYCPGATEPYYDSGMISDSEGLCFNGSYYFWILPGKSGEEFTRDSCSIYQE